VPRQCTAEEKAEMCKDSGAEMMTLCLPPTMERSGEVTVTAPPDIAKLRETAVKLREQAAAAKAKEEANPPPAEEKAEAAGEEKKGGMFGGMMGMVNKGLEAVGDAAEAADKAVNKAAGAVMSTVLSSAADLLDKGVDKVESPLTAVGKETVADKKEAIQKVLTVRINGLKTNDEDPVKLCRGEEPHGGAQYKECPTDSLSKHVIMKGDLKSELREAVQDNVNDHASVKNWKALIDQYNKAASYCAEHNLTKLDPIQLDLVDHILSEIIQSLAKIMGEEEAKLRASSFGTKAVFAQTFAKVFSEETLTQPMYNKYKEEKTVKG